ncbi:MAG: S8 family serine peptidase, partial [Bryobacteraceae bacterium]
QRARLAALQSALRTEVVRRQCDVTGSMQTLLNAVFVSATKEQAAALRNLPGVERVQLLPRFHRTLNTALGLVDTPSAWSVLGGMQNAGAGMKIAVLDTGIDQNHAAFQDPSLAAPAGFPKCSGSDCAYTNNKVIVARSYVGPLALLDGTPQNTRPDDLSPRDRVGHGTAVAMIAAGETNTGPLASITGVAPKAFLGNYKIFGSPGVNDVVFGDVPLMALEDAFNDGMDVAVLSIGNPAYWSPSQQGADCGITPADSPCDPFAAAVQNATGAGLAVVISAGNDGNSGSEAPSLNTIDSPGDVADAITVGATTNSHLLYSTVAVAGFAGQGPVYALFGDGPKPASPLMGPVADVTALGDNGKACAPLNGSLAGSIALIQRGDCAFFDKVVNAQKAGAIGALIYQADGSDFLFPLTGLGNTGIPAALIGNTAGAALKSFVASHAGATATLNLSVAAAQASLGQVAYFSSHGPAIGNSGIKPEITAIGADLYTATETYDPNGDLYDPSGYTGVEGTSFAAPMVAGAIALVKQRYPNLTAAQLKSAIVDTASGGLNDLDANGNPVPARVTAVGAGQLDVAAAVNTTVTAEPAVVSFGVIGSGALPSQTLKLTGIGSQPVNLTLSVTGADSDANAHVTISPANLTLSLGQTAQVTVQLTGSMPVAGSYQGFISVQGGGSPLRIPYLYSVTDGVPYSFLPLPSSEFVGDVNGQTTLTFKVTDKYGVPVPNVQVDFQPTIGGGSISQASPATDSLGIAAAQVNLGSQPGPQQFTATASGATVYFDGRARPVPAIATGGVVNNASNQSGAVAPGSYVTIYGNGLSETTESFHTPYLPISLAGVSVSFDDTARKLSLPGRLTYVSPSQINVQVPWELQGGTAVAMKVSIGNSQSGLYTLALADTAPAFFEYDDPKAGLSAAALDEGYAVIGANHPAQRGHVVQFFVNGLGPVDSQPADGEVSPADPLAHTRVIPAVTIGGKNAEVTFSGLAPKIVGLYQVNAVVPNDATAGLQSVSLTVNGVTAKATQLSVQ